MIRFYILIGLLLIANIGFAQTMADVLRYSQTTNPGTARSAAMSGAFGALGGDLSSFSSNPAGIGVFRSSELSITPSLNFSTTKSNNRSANDNSFQIGDLGGVVSFYNSKFDWRGFNFGINYTNLNNFNRRTNQYVANSPNSFAQMITHMANYDIENGFGESVLETMASETNVILFDENTGFYAPIIQEVNQYKTIKEEGNQGEYAFTFGTNYKDKLYLGLTIGLQSIYYKSTSIYTENPAFNDSELDYYDYQEYLKTTGVAANFKFGVIYRPIPQLRLEAAIHTPTYYSMTDRYYSDMYSLYKTPDADGYYDYLSNPYEYKYDYNLRTPWRAILSAATVLQQKAILSIDYEYIDFTSAKLSNGDNGYDFYDSEEYGPGINNDIKRYLRATHNVRIGAEYRVNSITSTRIGYSLYASPYKHDKNLNKIQTVSAGFGLNFGQFYCDAAYIYKFSKDITSFYSYIDPDDPNFNVIAEPVTNKYNDHQVRVTLGVKF